VSKMNGPTRIKLNKTIAKHCGEYCRGCGALPEERQLVIDHKDNNNQYNDLNNLQLLCRRCNYLKNPRRPVDECVSECESGAQTEIQINKSKEMSFRKFVYHELNEYNKVSEHDLINVGAEDIGISPVTAKRYLDKMCSSRGVCMRVTEIHTTVIKYKSNLDDR